MFPLFTLLAINMLYTKSKTAIKINFNDVFKDNNSHCVKSALTSVDIKCRFWDSLDFEPFKGPN